MEVQAEMSDYKLEYVLEQFHKTLIRNLRTNV